MRAPSTVEELMERARGLSGATVGEVALSLGLRPPPDLRRDKGFVGQLVETALGATSRLEAGPDFPELGVEVKTVPVDAKKSPRESTHVCTAPLDSSLLVPWSRSAVRHKLSTVLFVPVLVEKDVASRSIGDPVLWRPSPADDALLQADWDALREVLATGELHRVDARAGRALQLRPKARDGRATAWAQDEDADWVRTMPLGFYLRPTFTRELLAR